MIKQVMVAAVFWPVVLTGAALVLLGELGCWLIEWVEDFELKHRLSAAVLSERNNGSKK